MKEDLIFISCLIPILTIIGVLIFGYLQGWFSKK